MSDWKASYHFDRCKVHHLHNNQNFSHTEIKIFITAFLVLLRDARCKRDLFRHAVSVSLCVYVRLFVTFVNSVKTNKHIFKFFFTIR